MHGGQGGSARGRDSVLSWRHETAGPGGGGEQVKKEGRGKKEERWTLDAVRGRIRMRQGKDGVGSPRGSRRPGGWQARRWAWGAVSGCGHWPLPPLVPERN